MAEVFSEMRETLQGFTDVQIDSILGYVRNAILQVSGKTVATSQAASVVPFALRGERASDPSAKAADNGNGKSQISAGGSK